MTTSQTETNRREVSTSVGSSRDTDSERTETVSTGETDERGNTVTDNTEETIIDERGTEFREGREAADTQTREDSREISETIDDTFESQNTTGWEHMRDNSVSQEFQSSETMTQGLAQDMYRSVEPLTTTVFGGVNALSSCATGDFEQCNGAAIGTAVGALVPGGLAVGAIAGTIADPSSRPMNGPTWDRRTHDMRHGSCRSPPLYDFYPAFGSCLAGVVQPPQPTCPNRLTPPRRQLGSSAPGRNGGHGRHLQIAELFGAVLGFSSGQTEETNTNREECSEQLAQSWQGVTTQSRREENADTTREADTSTLALTSNREKAQTESNVRGTTRLKHTLWRSGVECGALGSLCLTACMCDAHTQSPRAPAPLQKQQTLMYGARHAVLPHVLPSPIGSHSRRHNRRSVALPTRSRIDGPLSGAPTAALIASATQATGPILHTRSPPLSL